MRFAVQCLSSILLLLAVSACAIADVAKTSPPPLTLGPAPIIMTKGSCELTSDLEAWAQAAYYQTTDFIQTLNAASAKGRNEVYNDVLHLHDLRTNMISHSTPDCALDTQIALADAMDRAVRALQSYGNGDLKDLPSLLPDLNARLQIVISMENKLFDRLSARYPTPQRTPTSVGVPAGG